MFIQRAFSAVVIVSATALFVYLGGIFFASFVAAISAVATRELCRLFSKRGLPPLCLITIAATLAFVFDAHFGFGLVAPIVLLLTLVPLIWQVFATLDHWDATIRWALTPIAAIYVGLPMSYFVLLRNLSSGPGLGGLSPGLWWATFAILGTWASDTGAYITGAVAGRQKFMERISPHKTWAGVVGGVLWPAVLGAAMGMWVLSLGLLHGLIIGALIGFSAILGDLGESLIKRGTGVKDTGRILPGHGGMLDRLDSLIFTGPLVYYYLAWIVRPA